MKKEVTSEMCAAFNTLRKENQGIKQSNKELSILLSQIFGVSPSTITTDYLPKLVKWGALECPKRGNYYFTSDPVHIEKLKNAFKTARSRKSSVKPEHKPSESAEQTSINILTKLGYKILKPTLDVEAALKNPEEAVSKFIKYKEL